MKILIEKHYLLYFLFLFAPLYSCSQYPEERRAKTGDILFVSTIQPGLTQAISDVTEVSEPYSYTHMGLLEESGDTLFLIHASTENGVERIPLDTYMCRDQDAVYHIYRISAGGPDLQKAVNLAKQYIGQDYNWTYVMNDTSKYCSELVFLAFEEDSIFRMEPMTFREKDSDKLNPYWEHFYEQRNMPVPEGQPGCNPNGMSQNEQIEKIFTATYIGGGDVQFYTVDNISELRGSNEK